VGRGDEDGSGCRASERGDVEAGTVDGHSHRLQPCPADNLVMVTRPGVLQSNVLDAGAGKGAERQHESVPASASSPMTAVGAVRPASRMAHIQSRSGAERRSGTPYSKSTSILRRVIVEVAVPRVVRAVGDRSVRPLTPAATRVPEPAEPTR